MSEQDTGHGWYWALSQMQKGREVRRGYWPKDHRFFLLKRLIMWKSDAKTRPAAMTVDHFFGRDWSVYG